MVPAPINPETAKNLIALPPSSPDLSTSEVACPSGKLSFCFTMSAERKGMVNNTPNTPPHKAIKAVSQKLKDCQYPIRIKAGKVKIAPAAKDSPAEAAVCTALFSRILCFLNKLNMAIEITAAGIDADTVNPANKPR